MYYLSVSNIATRFLLLFALIVCCNHAFAQEHGSPMSCTVEGRIVCVCNTDEKDEKSLCSKYPCIARVAVLQVSRCGSSVTQMPIVGDTISMRFAYTLHKTKKILPDMKKQYPGLKRKKVFTANVEQRIVPDGVEYMVYDYSLK